MLYHITTLISTYAHHPHKYIIIPPLTPLKIPFVDHYYIACDIFHILFVFIIPIHHIYLCMNINPLSCWNKYKYISRYILTIVTIR